MKKKFSGIIIWKEINKQPLIIQIKIDNFIRYTNYEFCKSVNKYTKFGRYLD